ncbi:MAG: hypothetical protein JO165_11830 [Candidatus Eremiobacteraeota bacterium]|nr:hypothetical protein [Candidatus Eremiobacteraeota bacterium]
MRFLKRWLRIERPESAAIRPSRKIVVDAPYDEAFDRTLHGIEQVLGGVVRDSDRETGSIEATFGLTFAERLSCSLERADEEHTNVRITSRRGVQAEARQHSDYVDVLAKYLNPSG